MIDLLDFREELIDAVVEVSMETNMSLQDLLGYAELMLEDLNRENYIKKIERRMFADW